MREVKFRGVSIPYRLATNILDVPRARVFRSVSIPYRLATNLNEILLEIRGMNVSIPYRLATNLNIEHVKSLPYRFQFLIG